MCAERHLKSLTCLRVSRLSNYQLCIYIIECKEVISYLGSSKKILSLSPRPSLHSFLEEIYLWFGHISQESYFHPYGSPLSQTPRCRQYLFVFMTKRVILNAMVDFYKVLKRTQLPWRKKGSFLLFRH